MMNKTQVKTEAPPGADTFTFTKEERRWYALGALKAALLIGLAYAVGLGLVILMLLFLWGAV